MTAEEKRIAIAEACGWKHVEHKYIGGESAGSSWVAPDGVGRNLPDYLNDLNAMHEAEKTILTTFALKSSYRASLCALTSNNSWHATAAQRAEALLKTIGKWEDA